MCGRFAYQSNCEIVRLHFSLDAMDVVDQGHNLAPGQSIPVIRERAGEGRVLEGVKWGFVPHWAHDLHIKPQINARAETVHEKPFFRDAFRQRRCIIVADGWYEWYQDAKKKTPYFFKHRNHEPLGFAGLWSVNQRDGQHQETVAIITVAATGEINRIHHRMPFVLDVSQYDAWLSDKTFSRVSLSSEHTFPIDSITFHEVTSL